MSKSWLGGIAFLLGTAILGTSVTLGNTVATITDSGGAHSRKVRPEDPGTWNFDLTVEVATDANLVSGQFYITDVGHTGTLTINSVTYNDPPWDSGGALPFVGPQTLNASNGYTTTDIGAMALDLVNGVTGTQTFITFNVSVMPAAGQNYVLQLTNLFFGNTAWEEDPSTAGPAYQITVTPEPETAVLGFVSLCLAGWLKGRRRVAVPVPA